MQIREAVDMARHRWPEDRFYTYVDPAKAKPVMVRGIPCFGFCFYKAGWKFDGVTQSGKLIWATQRQGDSHGPQEHHD